MKEQALQLSNNITFVSYDVFNDIDVEKTDLNFAKIVEYYQNFESMNPHNVNPNYLKKTEAEENLYHD